MAFKHTIIKKYPLLATFRQLLVWFFLWYLRVFAKIALFSFRGTSIGIAGAVGKSTARNALAAILAPHKPTLVVYGNSETGIPLGLLGLDIKSYRARDFVRVMLCAPFRIRNLVPYTFLIVEMGIDGPNPPKNMEYLVRIIQPDIGILLNESPAHVANYESHQKLNSLDQILSFMTNDDGKMLAHAHAAIVNGEDPYIAEFIKTLPRQSVRTVGMGKHHDISVSYHEVTDDKTTFEFSIHSFQEKEDLMLNFQGMVLPKEAGIALGAAILTALALGLKLSDIRNNLPANFSLPPGRGTILPGINDSVIFDSSYNISSASALSFLNLMKTLTQKTRRPIFFVMGDMKELGSFSAYEHGKVAKAIPESVHHVILVGPLTKELMLPKMQGKKLKTIIHFNTSREAGEYLRDHLPQQSIILFKGSQLLEESIKYILKDKNDEKKLCRQDEFWKTAKKTTGTWVDI
jgi:UDP-N-acetylmuramoyl-tripeptide--D-alanyl-D-alanine ligase